MGQSVIQVDAFTHQPFHGNPAAICVLDGPGDESWMQNLAIEMNLSETAYLFPEQDGYNLRWFTPAAEVELCGHATVAAAHVLWEEGLVAPDDSCRFHTRSGLLTALRDGEWIDVSFPRETLEAFELPGLVADALGIESVYAGKNRLSYVLIEVEDEECIRALEPDYNALGEQPFHGYIVTSRSSTAGFDFVSRFFAPRLGINEDPVTGSAHCVLGPYWAGKLGKQSMVAYQASSRGGTVRVSVEEDRVRLGGQAVTVMKGALV